MNTPQSVLFICTGNTCRSPMAEYLFRRMAEKEGLSVETFSRGVGAWDGSPLSRGAMGALKAAGIDASAHRAMKLTPADVERADLILVMEEGHRIEIVSEYPDATMKTFLLRDYAGDGKIDIRDPIGSDASNYHETRQTIESALLSVLLRLEGKDRP